MRLLVKLTVKLVLMVVTVLVMGSVMRHGTSMLTHFSGPAGGPQFSSEEADLMSTVFKSALRMFSGTAKRDVLASELSDKLYAGRDTATMSELGIELVKPGGAPALPKSGPGAAPGAAVQNSERSAGTPKSQPDANSREKHPGNPGALAASRLTENVRTDVLGRIGRQMRKYSVELGLIPVVFLGMILLQRIRGAGARGPGSMPLLAGIVLPPPESEAFEMKHLVHSLGPEDFELLVALIYQRQGYRISMPAGLGGGRGTGFTLLRKSERIIVQCKKLDLLYRVPVEKIRELHDAMAIAGVTRGIYVATCGFTWDARNYGKTNGITVINARTLDELLTAARQNPEENLLAVSQWAPQFMSKVQLTATQCPACEAAMDQLSISNGSVWLCSQRPECRGRRSARKYLKPPCASVQKKVLHADEVAS